MREVTRVPEDPLDGEYRPVPWRLERPDPASALRRSSEFRELMATRRSVRMFSTDPVPYELVANAVATAATSPSGAHAQPWTFVVVSDPTIKAAIRSAAEEEERARTTAGCRMSGCAPCPAWHRRGEDST